MNFSLFLDISLNKNSNLKGLLLLAVGLFVNVLPNPMICLRSFFIIKEEHIPENLNILLRNMGKYLQW